MKPKFTLRRMVQYFLQGLIILAPIVITVWAVTSLFHFVDNILPNIIAWMAPNLLPKDRLGNPINIPGSGSLLVILIVMVVGYISTSFIVGRMVTLFDNLLEKLPGIKIIYSTVKDFMEAFAGNKRKFNRPVLVNIESPDVWRMGFITQEDASQFGLNDHMAVYLPHSYAFSGILYIIRKDRIKPVNDLSSADAMKFVISGGVTDVEDDHTTP